MIQVFKPFYDHREKEAVNEVLDSGWVGLGPKTAEFEKRFANFIGAKYVVGLNSCTAALDMALRLIGIRPGDQVIVPTMTFVSTAHAVVYNGGIPLFCDVHPETLTMDMDHVEYLLRKHKNVKAVIPVHYAGRPVELDALESMALRYPFKIIEDCAHAVGSYYRGEHVGSRNIACFSFHAVKNLAMGEGGALALPAKFLQERALKDRWLGIDKGTWDRTDNDKSYWWEYNVDKVGLKSHLNDIHAAIGLVQLDKLEEMNEYRRGINREYRAQYSKYVDFMPADDEIYKSSWHFTCIQTDQRDKLSIFLKNKGVNTGVHYKPIHLYPCYGNQPTLPVAEKVFKRLLTLPSYPGLTKGDFEIIDDAMKEFFHGA